MSLNLDQLGSSLAGISPIHNGIFKYFLGLSEDCRVLIVESSQGGTTISLSKNVNRLMCLCSNASEAKEIALRLKKENIRNVVLILGSAEYLPFRDSVFDLVCQHRAQNIKSSLKYKYPLMKTGNEAIRVLRDGGSWYYSYIFPKNESLFKRLFAEKYCGLTSLHGILWKAACVYHHESFEKLFFVKICNHRNWLKEKPRLFQIKRRLIGENIGFIARKGHDNCKGTGCLLSKIRSKVEEELGLYLSDTDIIRAGSGGSVVVDFGEVILRIPQTKFAEYRCKKNYSALAKLKNSSIGIEVPQAMSHGTIHGEDYFAESKIIGMSLDLHKLSQVDKESIYKQAYALLIDRDKVVLGCMDELFFQLLVYREFEEISPYISSSDRSVLNRVLDLMKDRFISEKLLLVIQHGDFKSSNFICSNGYRKKLIGIVDWDMSSIPGIPLIDLFSLQMDKNGITKKTLVKEIWPMTMITGKNNPIKRYIRRMGISEMSLKLIGVLVIIRYLNKFYWPKEIKKHPEWYKDFISGCLIPVSLRCISEIKQ